MFRKNKENFSGYSKYFRLPNNWLVGGGGFEWHDFMQCYSVGQKITVVYEEAHTICTSCYQTF